MINTILKFGFKIFFLFLIFTIVFSNPSFAASGNENGSYFASTFFLVAIILLAAKLSSLVERFGQPAVLGELIVGVILGNLTLLGFYFFEPIKENLIILFLAELGVVILLFQIGLESNIQKMFRVGGRAFLVALVGVVAPFVLGTYLVGPRLLPGLSFNTYLFLGAILTATSVGITARVFRDLGKMQTKEAQIVLGAAVIDDIFGLIILAVISDIVRFGATSFEMIFLIIARAIIFLVMAILIGQLTAPYFGRIFAKISTSIGMKLTMALFFCLTSAYLAQKIGLAPIIGAFAGGLVLDPVHFKYFKNPEIIDDLKNCIRNAPKKTQEQIYKIIHPHAHNHIEDLIEPVSHFLTPIFFVITGINVKLETLFNWQTLLLALGVTTAALLGKVASGLAAGKSNKLIVGFGMAPRGEVGLIFATVGKSLGVISDEIFSIIVIMVIFTTLLTPPVLAFLLKRQKN